MRINCLVIAVLASEIVFMQGIKAISEIEPLELKSKLEPGSNLRSGRKILSNATNSSNTFNAVFVLYLPLENYKTGSKVKISIDKIGRMAECQPSPDMVDANQAQKKIFCTLLSDTSNVVSSTPAPSSTTVIFQVTLPLSVEQFATLQAAFLQAIAQTIGINASKVSIISYSSAKNTSARRNIAESTAVTTAVEEDDSSTQSSIRSRLSLEALISGFESSGLPWGPSQFVFVDSSGNLVEADFPNNSFWNASDFNVTENKNYIFAMLLSISYVEFEGQKTLFVQLVAETAQVSPNLVQILRTETVRNSSGRRSNENLRVETEIMTNDAALAAAAESRLKIDSLAKAFAVRGLDWIANTDGSFNSSGSASAAQPQQTATANPAGRNMLPYVAATILVMLAALLALRYFMRRYYKGKIEPDEFDAQKATAAQPSGNPSQTEYACTSQSPPRKTFCAFENDIAPEQACFQEHLNPAQMARLSKQEAEKDVKVSAISHTGDNDTPESLGKPQELYYLSSSGYKLISAPTIGPDEERRRKLLEAAERILHRPSAPASIGRLPSMASSPSLRDSPAAAASASGLPTSQEGKIIRREFVNDIRPFTLEDENCQPILKQQPESQPGPFGVPFAEQLRQIPTETAGDEGAVHGSAYVILGREGKPGLQDGTELQAMAGAAIGSAKSTNPRQSKPRRRSSKKAHAAPAGGDDCNVDGSKGLQTL